MISNTKVDPDVFDHFDLDPQVYDGIPVLLDIIDEFGLGLIPLLFMSCCCCCCCLPCVAVKKGYNLYLKKQAEQEQIDKAVNVMSQRVFEATRSAQIAEMYHET